MPSSHPVWLVPLALTLVGFGLSAASATAQNTYTINSNYDVLANSRAITSNISAVSILGDSTDAPYGLTTINGLLYSQVDFATSSFRFNTDPTTFGLQGEPFGSIVLGSGSNKLFGTDDASGIIDFGNLTATATGTFTITGGSGMFTGASGTLAFSEVDTLSLDPSVPTRARSSLNGSFQVAPTQVPEPRTDMTMLLMSVIGAGVLLRRYRTRHTSI